MSTVHVAVETLFTITWNRTIGEGGNRRAETDDGEHRRRTDDADLGEGRCAQDHPRRKRTRVYLEGARSLGLRERRHAGLHPAEQADRQLSSRASTVVYATNASTHTDSCRWRALGPEVEAWRRDCDESRPHTSLGWPTSIEYSAVIVKIAAE